MIDYNTIKNLSRALGRPAETLYALSNANDPFFCGPARQEAAKWFARLWHRLEIPIGFHYRRIHYRLVSLPEPILLLNGQPYQNTQDCWTTLNLAARDAVALDLIPSNAFVDRRNGGAKLFQVEREDASIDLLDGSLEYDGISAPSLPRIHAPSLPRLILGDRPTIPQPFQVEIWAEKTTVNDILMPLGRQYKLNVVTGVGELSAIAFREFVDRVQQHARPTRVCYVSDFDPAGRSMPVAVARKIEFELHRRALDLDIQVRPVVLTPEQCAEYQLPRIPLKPSERRATAFEARFGEGATELDALEAIHPGLLQRLLIAEINRYWKPEHEPAVERTCRAIETRLEELTASAAERHPQLNALLADFEEIEFAYNNWAEHTEAAIAAEVEEFRHAHDRWLARAKPVWHAIQNDLEENAPDLNNIKWSTPDEADEDLDPLFDSNRDYVGQIDRYKAHQGKLTARRRQIVGSMHRGAVQKRKWRERNNPSRQAKLDGGKS